MEETDQGNSKYLIGTLKGATNMPEYREESAFYEEVKKVRSYLARKKGKSLPRDSA